MYSGNVRVLGSYVQKQAGGAAAVLAEALADIKGTASLTVGPRHIQTRVEIQEGMQMLGPVMNAHLHALSCGSDGGKHFVDQGASAAAIKYRTVTEIENW